LPRPTGHGKHPGKHQAAPPIKQLELWRLVRPGEPAIGVRELALEWSIQTSPANPIRDVEAEASLGAFEGGLFALETNGWAILYNRRRSTPGRANFTIAQQLGHYALHRTVAQKFECSASATLGVDLGTYKQREREADEFASNLLMPAGDFRAQVEPERIKLELLWHCANRYRVSMTAAVRRWIALTDQPAALVASVDGFILWHSRSRKAPYGRGDAIHPSASAAPGTGAHDSYRLWSVEQQRTGVRFQDTWLRGAERVETGIVSDRYGLTLTLRYFEHVEWKRAFGNEEPDEDAALERSWTAKF